ncbi:hypothetical protein E9228_002865 [Curtobacterium flaccumfaciens]|uniref:Glycosyltransferase RgtA/B/C/D-like domain-containing protein n=1 Tax=Curtobacterium salicis TaxID=1779862 RepID=A0ABX0TAW1_9MICO|nr:DUF4175 domain-containing protein [Curtobacterium sp. WW7]NII42207.1 hypothetical protein [Curtobacterium sp. WW7]
MATTIAPRHVRGFADVNRLVRLLESPWTFRITIALFVVVGAVLSVAIHMPVVDGVGHVPYSGTIAPDENRHIANILYYAGRSVWAGPVITDAPAQLLSMGEIERFPSYVYYYLTSFPVKAMLDVGAPYSAIVVALRFLNVLIAAAGLLVVHRLVRTMGMALWVATLVVVLLAATGRYEWQAAAVTYDTPANTLFFLCLLYCARLIRSSAHGYADLFRALVLGGAAIAVKYTFVPFVLVAVAVAFVLVVQRDGLRTFAHPVQRFRRVFAEHPVTSALWSALFVVTLAVLVERIGGNLLLYGQFNPSCPKLHTHQECLAFDIYRRNYWAERTHDLAIANNVPQTPFDVFEFVGSWISAYFQSMFFYRGRNTTWQVATWVQVAGAVTFVIALVAILTAFRALLRTRALVWGMVVAGSYVVAMFLFNLRTFLRLDNEYAFSGRYLLPVLPLVFAFMVLAGVALWRMLPVGWRRALIVPGVLLAAAVFVTYLGPVAFFTYARGESWYTPIALHLLPSFLTGVSS